MAAEVQIGEVDETHQAALPAVVGLGAFGWARLLDGGRREHGERQRPDPELQRHVEALDLAVEHGHDGRLLGADGHRADVFDRQGLVLAPAADTMPAESRITSNAVRCLRV